MKKYILIVCCMIAKSAYSQKITISTTVFDDKEIPVVGNVLLLDAAKELITSSYFEFGKISFETDYKGKANLIVSSFGFENYEKEIIVGSEDIALDYIHLKTNAVELAEVAIITKKPLFEKTVDGTRVNVENSLLSKSANSNELLGRVPTVSVVGGKANVFGRGEALLIMNGREITMESFKSLPPSDIKSIEVITNPDARYDAKGKAVIIVTMQKHFSQGLSATIVNSTTIGIIKNKSFGRYTVNTSNITLNFRKNKWDFSTYYTNELGTNWSENNFITTTGNFRKIGYYTEDNHNTSVHYYRLGVGYKLNEKSTISAQYDGLSHFFNLDVIQNGDFFNGNTFVTKIMMINAATTRLQNHSVNINYNNKINENGSTLFVGVQYNQFQNKLLDNITEHIDNNTYKRINDNLNTIHLYTAQTDYNHKLKNGGLDFGAKFSHTTNQGDIKFFSKNEAIPQSDYVLTLSNKVIYKETVPALYAIYKHQWKKINANIGLRCEYTIANSKSRIDDTTYFDNSYSNFFPSAKILYTINDNWKLNTSYNYKINRPLYQDLDPFLWYLDSLTSIRGNAKLKPEYLHQSEAKLFYKNFALRYAFTLSNKTITPVMMRNEASTSENAVVFTKDNIQQRTLHTIALEVPFEKGNYSCFNTLATNIFQFKDNRVEYKALKSKPQLYLYTYHTYKIPKWFTTEFTAEYTSSSSNGLTQLKPYYYFTLAFSRSFLKDNSLNLNLMWNDFARTAIWSGKYSANTFSNEFNQRFTISYLRFTLTYNITSKTQFNYNNKNVNESEFNRIKK